MEKISKGVDLSPENLRKGLVLLNPQNKEEYVITKTYYNSFTAVHKYIVIDGRKPVLVNNADTIHHSDVDYLDNYSMEDYKIVGDYDFVRSSITYNL